MIAGHAVIANCVYCGHPVRSTVTIHAELADLRDELRSASTRLVRDSCPLARRAYDREIACIDYQLAALRAELRGTHLLCAQPEDL